MRKSTSRARGVLLVSAMLGAVLATGARPVPAGAGARSQASPPPALKPKSGPLTPLLEAQINPEVAAATLDEAVPTTGPGTPIVRDDGALVVEIRLSSTDPAVLDRLRSAGARIIFVADAIATVTAEIAPDKLRTVAAIGPEVLSMDAVVRPQTNSTCPTGPTTSEGDVQLTAATGRANHGVDGSGIIVGVISDSYNYLGGAPADVSNGDLPGITNTCGRTTPVGVQAEAPPGANIDEGRAMAQIVHDLAPGATIRFATALSTEAAFAQQIRDLAANGAKVIVDDISYFAEPMYQDGVIAQAVEDVTAAGVMYFSSAGNSNAIVGGNHVAGYEAPAYRPTTCPPSVAALVVDCHDFNPGAGVDNTYGITVNATSGYILGWNEPQFNITTDLDMFVLNGAGTIIAQSINGLSLQKAYERVTFSTTAASIVVGRFTGTGTPRFRVSGNRPRLTAVEYPVSSGGDIIGPTAFGHNIARSGASVGAIPYNNASVLETFSSQGPATWCWGGVVGTTPAAPITPCQSATIDMAATDGTANSFFGSFTGGVWRFFGTSASAPHAAAVAALIRQKSPCLTPAQVFAVMHSTAQALPGYTVNAQGAGRLDANAALNAANGCKVPAFVAKTVHVTGLNGVPASGVAAVSMNVTVTAPDGDGYVTVYPCGTLPNASNLNFRASQTVPNAVIAPVSAGGDVCFVTSASTHLIVDVNGWFPISGSGVQPLVPVRLLDTRTGTGGVPVAPITANVPITLQVTGTNGIPGVGVAAVSLNVTVTGTQGGGYATVYPCGAIPNASNLNFENDQTVPNAVIAPVNGAGQICVVSTATTHLIIDANGWFPTAAFSALTPSRVFDTRSGIGGVPVGKIAAGGVLAVTVLNSNGVPASGVAAVALNVTVTDPSAGGYITVYPCGTLPNASSLNYAFSQTVPNAVIAPVSAGGQVCFYTYGATHLIADVSGYFPTGSTSFQGLVPARFLDTRSG